jgi:hypothetical protein
LNKKNLLPFMQWIVPPILKRNLEEVLDPPADSRTPGVKTEIPEADGREYEDGGGCHTRLPSKR